MRIAVIGSGISGLASAWLLSRRHDVVLFEANNYLGGHTHTHDIALQGRNYSVDTGFIVHNPQHYPLLTRLFAELGVATQPTTMSFAVHSDASGVEYNATSLATLYMVQVFPPSKVLSAFIIGMNLSSIAVPLAWVLSPSLVNISPWPSLYAFEAGLALCSLAAVIVLKLPTSVQIHVFEPLDFLTFALVTPAIALLCAVLVQGVNAW